MSKIYIPQENQDNVELKPTTGGSLLHINIIIVFYFLRPLVTFSSKVMCIVYMSKQA